MINKNSDDNNNNHLFKNENLKNMLNKLSEEAKKQFSCSSASNSSKLNELLNTKFFLEEKNVKHSENFNEKNNFRIENVENNENFTQQFYMERYKNYIPSNVITPADFNANINKDHKNLLLSGENNKKSNLTYDNQNISINNQHKNSQQNFNFFEIFFDKIKSDLVHLKSSQLNLENWIKCFNELHINNREKQILLREFLKTFNLKIKRNFVESILYRLEGFFSKYIINSDKEFVIGEISDIKFMDNLQIITIKDYYCNLTDFIIVEDTSNLENFDSSIRDDHFELNEIIIVKRNSMRLLNGQNPNLWVVSLGNIKQFN